MVNYFKTQSHPQKPVFSVLIPTWNNLDYVKLCVDSLRKNSAYPHQIILHVNDGSDGTRFWAEQQGLDFTHSATNVGVCFACNAAYSLAEADYIVYMNDDMYACPGWDTHLYAAIQEYGRPDFYFSGTMIEREPTPSRFISAPHDFGSNALNFREEALLATLPTLAIPDWQGANFPPSVMHRRMWDLIGGFSIEFSPGMYSDPDLCRKLWAAGVRNYRGIGNSLVYHFMSKSVQRVRKNNGRAQFLRKWGITARTFFDYYTLLRNQGRDVTYQGILPDEPPASWELKRDLVLSKIKALLLK
jgi:GT2 family glycosyltransferase